MKRVGRSFTEYLKEYLARITPRERAMYERARLHFAEENRRILKNQRKEN